MTAARRTESSRARALPRRRAPLRALLPRRLPADAPAVEPPVALPPGRLVPVPGSGELFVRDSGGDGPPVVLLHGWMFGADLNWWRVYDPLARAGYRVIALDHRGHGRGVRSDLPFRLEDCARDVLGLIEVLDVAPAFLVGYSMGGPIAQLATRARPDAAAGIVLCATAAEFGPRWSWYAMGLMRLVLGVFPYATWRTGLRFGGFPETGETRWTVAELARGSGRDIAEAGRELGRFDSRSWAPALGRPAASIVTTEDDLVPPDHQRELARLVGARVFELAADHLAVGERPDAFAALLIEALDEVGAPR